MVSNVNTPAALAHSMAESLLRENKSLRAENAALREYAERLREALEEIDEDSAHAAAQDALALPKPWEKPAQQEWPDEKRIDIIGSNGNDGLHYSGSRYAGTGEDDGDPR